MGEKEKGRTLEDLVPLLESRRPEDDGVGVVGGRLSVGESAGAFCETTSECLPEATPFEGDEASSEV